MPRKLAEEYSVRKPYVCAWTLVGKESDEPDDCAEGIGFSKASCMDPFDRQLGQDLAESRALKEAFSNYYDKRIQRLLKKKYGKDLPFGEKCVEYAQGSTTVTDATTWQTVDAREARLDEMVQILVEDGVIPFGAEDED